MLAPLAVNDVELPEQIDAELTIISGGLLMVTMAVAEAVHPPAPVPVTV